MTNLANLFLYTVITEEGEVLGDHMIWDDVQSLADFLEVLPIDVFSCHQEPGESTVTFPVISQEQADLIYTRELVKQLIAENPPTAEMIYSDLLQTF